MIGTKIYKNNFDEVLYAECAQYCNEHSAEAQIEDKVDYYEVTEIPEPTEEEKQDLQYQQEAEQAAASIKSMESRMMKTLLTGGDIAEVQSAYQISLMSLSDGAAIKIADYFPDWSGEGHQYSVGDRVEYDGELYKVIQAHTSQADWDPKSAPSLFAKVLTSQTGEPLPWVQPDSTNPYMRGDQVTWKGKVYESMIDNNVWSPTDYPDGWKEI